MILRIAMDVLTEIGCRPSRVIDVELDVDAERVVRRLAGRWQWISLDHWLLDKYYEE